jgi:hypothetical protein
LLTVPRRSPRRVPSWSTSTLRCKRATVAAEAALPVKKTWEVREQLAQRVYRFAPRAARRRRRLRRRRF